MTISPIGKDKDYGYIDDFEELFGSVQQALAVYNSDELDTKERNGGTNNITLKAWLVEGKKKLDNNLQSLRYLCGPVRLLDKLSSSCTTSVATATPPTL